MADLIGQRLGQYEITALLGEGGMATVYRARQAAMGRDVAIKVIESRLTRSPEFVKRFEREARTIAALSQSHILKVFDYGHEGNLLYLVMELLTGGSLADRIRLGPLPLDEARRILEQIASALDYAHRKGIIHRDLKPQNVLLDEAGDAHLTDFGIAKVISETTALTQSGVSMGTPAYMSPEQCRGGAVDARSDVYALGVMLFEMLAGRVPFQADTPVSMVYMHLQEPPPKIRTLRADLPPAVEVVMDVTLAKDPERRFQTAGELAAAFEMAGRGELPPGLEPALDLTSPMPFGADQPPLAVEEAEPPSRRGGRAGLLALGAIALVAVIGIGLLLIGGGGGQLIPAGTRNEVWAPVEREFDGVAMVWVPPGCFRMGSTEKQIADLTQQYGDYFKDEGPVHEVCITQGFWLDKYEVTNAAYQRFIDAGGYSRREYWSEEGWNWKGSRSKPDNCAISDFYGPQQPVVCVTWYEAEAYANWRGGRLPTEAEWEYAARGPEGPVYPWGNTFDGTRLNFCDKNCEYGWRDAGVDDGYKYTAPVGNYEGGKSWVGAYDLSGNVWEWVADWYDETYYANSPREDPPGPASGSARRVVRGGSWFLDLDGVRAAFRSWRDSGYRLDILGFRVCRPPSQ